MDQSFLSNTWSAYPKVIDMIVTIIPLKKVIINSVRIYVCCGPNSAFSALLSAFFV